MAVLPLPQPYAPSTQSGTQVQGSNTVNQSNQSGQNNSYGTATGNQANVYTQGQQNLQGQVGGAIGNTLAGGGIPGADTNFVPQQMQAYADYYNRYVAPGQAAQGGAGSPAMASGLALGLEQLQAGLGSTIYQTNAGAYNNALNTGTQAAYTPTGQNTSGTNATNTANSTNAVTNTTNVGAGSWQTNSNPNNANPLLPGLPNPF